MLHWAIYFSQIDTTGLGIVLLEYLLDREWVPEEQIATDLGQHHKIVRRALKFLEHVGGASMRARLQLDMPVSWERGVC